jgi:hypothetical protein
MPLPFYMDRVGDPLCPRFLKPTGEDNEEDRTEERKNDLCRLRRETPYPECTGICPVTDAFGPDECRVICPGKFKGE